MERRALALLLVAAAATPALAGEKKKPATARHPGRRRSERQLRRAVRALSRIGAHDDDDGRARTSAWMAGLNADLRARNVNDLVTVQVLESIVGRAPPIPRWTRRATAAAA